MPEKCKLILVADDDVEDLELLQEALLQCEPDLKIQFANSGKRILDFLMNNIDNGLPSLIILDYNMPDMNGAEVLAKLSNNPRYQAIPKVVWSTSNNSKYIRECMESGATSYFVKPSSAKELQNQAKEMLALCVAQLS